MASTVTLVQQAITTLNLALTASKADASQITALTAQVATLTTQVATLNTQVATLNTQISTLAAQVTAEAAQITTDTAQATAQAAEIATLEAEVTSLTQQTPRQVKYYALAEPNWDQYTKLNDADLHSWIAICAQRLRSFYPFYRDIGIPAWYQVGTNRGVVYIDLLCMYVQLDAYGHDAPGSIAALHPDWILKDASGNRLFVNGITSQYAMDISNPAFVAQRISDIKTCLSGGFTGLFLDDTNYAFSFGGGIPIDPNTKATMTLDNWQKYLTALLTAIRAATPGIEITQNQVWYTGRPDQNAQIAAGMAQCDLVYAERGFGQLDGGQGSNSLSSFLIYTDKVHAAGKPLVYGDYYVKDLNFSLACYFLASNGSDYFGITEQTPALTEPYWPAIYATNLGTITSGRQWDAQGVWVRTFSKGGVKVNEMGQPMKTVALPAGALGLDGKPLTSVTLGPGAAVIYTL